MHKILLLIANKYPFLDSYTAAGIVAFLSSFGPTVLKILGGATAVVYLVKGIIEARGRMLDNDLKKMDMKVKEKELKEIENEENS